MNSYIYYRQHEKNVVGVKKSNLLTDVKMKIKKMRNAQERNGRSFLAKEIKRCFPECSMSYPLLVDSAEYNRVGLIKNATTISSYSGETIIGLCIKILLGLY